MSDNPEPKDAFISHSSEDAALALGLAHQLEQTGLRCWIAPRDIRQGEVYANEIMSGIRECPVLVLLHSAAADQSQFVWREVNEAVSLQKKILPVRLGKFAESDRMRFLLAGIQWETADLRPGTGDHQALAERLHALLARPQPQQRSASTDKPKSATFSRWLLYAAAALLAGLAIGGGYLASRQNDRPPALSGEVDVRVLTEDSDRNERTLGEYGIAPVRDGERVRIEAKLDRSAYVYLVWLSSDGPAPAYPWAPQDWTRRVGQEMPQEQLSLPVRADRAYPMKCGDGTEAVLLLARSTPLPPTIDLKALLNGFPHQPNSSRFCYRLRGAQVEVVAPPSTPASTSSTERPADFSAPAPVLDGPLDSNQSLRSWWVAAAERLAPHFDHVSGIVFPTSPALPASP